MQSSRYGNRGSRPVGSPVKGLPNRMRAIRPVPPRAASRPCCSVPADDTDRRLYYINLAKLQGICSWSRDRRRPCPSTVTLSTLAWSNAGRWRSRKIWMHQPSRTASKQSGHPAFEASVDAGESAPTAVRHQRVRPPRGTRTKPVVGRSQPADLHGAVFAGDQWYGARSYG